MPNFVAVTALNVGSVSEPGVTPASQPQNINSAVDWFRLVFLCAISLLVTGHKPYQANQAVELPYVNVLRDPSLYPNDPMVATVRHHTTLFWKGVAAVSRVVPVSTLLLWIFIAERLLALYAIQRIARSLSPGFRLFHLGALLAVAFVPSPLVGNGTTLPDYAEHTGVTVAILLLAFAFLFERRYLAWAVVTGLSINLNALYVVYSLPYAAAVLLAMRRPRRDWLFVIGMGPMVFSLGIPVLVAAFREPPQGHYDTSLWFDAMFARSAIHLRPGTWPRPDFAKFAGLVLATLIASIVVARKKTAVASLGFLTTFICIAWVGLAFVAGYGVRSRPLLQLQPIRGTDLWYFFAAIVLVFFIAKVLSRFVGDGLASTLCLVALFLPLAWTPSSQHESAPLLLALFGGIACYLAAEHISQPMRRSVARGMAVALAVSVAGFGLHKQMAASQPARLFGSPLTPRDYEIYRAADFASAIAPKDAVFLVDPIDRVVEPFRALSNRSVFVEWKDGTAFFYDLAYVQTWCDRMNATGADAGLKTTPVGRPYKAWQDADVERLAAVYRVNYWIVPVTQATKLQAFWTGKYWKILKVV